MNTESRPRATGERRLRTASPKTRKLHERIAISIGTEIVSGAIPPGSILPTEKEAIERLNVSKTPYREAIRTLASKGLIVSRAATGTKVNPRREWALLDPDVLAWMFASKPSAQSIKALFELRMIVEPASAALAAERRSPEQLAVMGHALQEMAEHGLSAEAGQHADGRFHATILEATGNEYLEALTDSIATAVRWTTTLKFAATKRPRNPLGLHRDLFSAIADRQPDRARSITESLLIEAHEDTETALKCL